MKSIVFISWHSDKQGIGKKISNCFREYLGQIFCRDIKVFASNVDIKHGWNDELTKALDGSKYGIMILTPQALDSTWMPYEFGVLRRNPKHVWCFHFGNVGRETLFSINQYLEFTEGELSAMLEAIVSQEWADKEIDGDDAQVIRGKIKEFVPKLLYDVSEIAKDIDYDYICNRDIRKKYEILLKNGSDLTLGKRVAFEATITDLKNQVERNEKALKDKDKEIARLTLANGRLKIEKNDLQSRIDELEKTLSLNLSKYGNAVDLGLPSGTLWADRNIGASSFNDYGEYFAWGEIKPKNGKYTLDTYTYHDKPKLLPHSHDAASANWGKEWEMPTKEQFDELIKYCEWHWTGKGYEVAGNNGNIIYLPAAGYKNEKLEEDRIWGEYWSSSLYKGDFDYAWYLSFGLDGCGIVDGARHDGCTVRAVLCRD